MATELLEKYGTNITGLTMIPSGGGVFEVIINNQLVFSKKELNRSPNDGEVVDLIKSN